MCDILADIRTRCQQVRLIRPACRSSRGGARRRKRPIFDQRQPDAVAADLAAEQRLGRIRTDLLRLRVRGT